ncbi:hypothetical protein M885DRAFT_570501 [Pelagophyceae sp. CCMP2097]|nr:hypothetical protein M885DRAFT_570501 [Pelagophyceae sp. CCMP2097]
MAASTDVDAFRALVDGSDGSHCSDFSFLDDDAAALRAKLPKKTGQVFFRAQYAAAGPFELPNPGIFDEADLPENSLRMPLVNPAPRGRPRSKRGRQRSDFVKAYVRKCKQKGRPAKAPTIEGVESDDDSEEKGAGDEDKEDDASDEDEEDEEEADSSASEEEEKEEEKEEEPPRSPRLRNTPARRANTASAGFAVLPGSGAA